MPDATITILLSILGSAAGVSKALNSSAEDLERWGRRFMILGREMTMVGMSLTASITLPLVGLATAAVKAASSFENEMHRVAGISSYVRDNFQDTYQKVNNLSVQFAIPAEDMAKALYQVYSAGITGAQGLDLLAVAAKASVAGLTTPEVALRGIIAVLTAYHLPISQATEVSDILFRTVDKGIFTFDELVASISSVIPSAAMAKINLKELGAAYVLMSRAGFSAAETGTALNRFIRDFYKPSKDALDLAKKLGIEFSADALTSKGLAAVINEVASKVGLYEIVATQASASAKSRAQAVTAQADAQTLALEQQILALEKQKNAIAGSDKASVAARKEIQNRIDALRLQTKDIALNAKEQKAAILSAALGDAEYNKVMAAMAQKTGLTIQQLVALFPDVRALRAAFVLTANGGKDFNSVLEEMQDATGATGRVFEEQTKSILFHWNQMVGSFKALANDLVIRYGPRIVKILDLITQWIEKLRTLSPQTQDTILKFLALAAAIGPLLLLGGQLSRSFGLLVFTFSLAKKAVGSLGESLLPLILKLSGLGLAVLLLKEGWDRDWLGMRTTLEPVLKGITNALLGFLPPEVAEAIRQKLKDLFGIDLGTLTFKFDVDAFKRDVLTKLKPLSDIWEGIRPTWEKSLSLLKQIVWDDLLSPILDWIEKNVIPKIKELNTYWDKSFASDALKILKPLLDGVNSTLASIDRILKDWEKKGGLAGSLGGLEKILSAQLGPLTVGGWLMGLGAVGAILWAVQGALAAISAITIPTEIVIFIESIIQIAAATGVPALEIAVDALSKLGGLVLSESLTNFLKFLGGLVGQAGFFLFLALIIGELIQDFDQFKAAWENLWALVAAPEIEELKKAWEDFKATVKPAIEDLKTALNDLATALGPFGVILKTIGDVIGALLRMGLAMVIMTVIVGVIGDITLAIKAMALGLQAVKDPIAAAIKMIADLARSLTNLAISIRLLVNDPSWDKFQQFADRLDEFAARAAQLSNPSIFATTWAIGTFTDLWNKIQKLMNPPAAAAGEGSGKAFGEGFGAGMSNAQPQLTTTTGSLVATVISLLDSQIPRLISSGISFVQALAQGLMAGVGAVVNALAYLGSLFGFQLFVLGVQLFARGQALVNWLSAGIQSAAGAVFGAINLIGNFIWMALSSIPLGMFNWGRSIMDGLLSGIASKMADLVAIIDAIAGLFPHSPAEWGPLKELPDWKSLYQGMEDATGVRMGERAAGALRESLFGIAGMKMQPIALRVFIGDHEIKDVSMTWAYQAISEALK